MGFWKTFVGIALLVGLNGCAAVAVGGAVVSTTGAVVGTAVSTTTTVAGAAVDIAVPDGDEDD